MEHIGCGHFDIIEVEMNSYSNFGVHVLECDKCHTKIAVSRVWGT